MKSKQPKQVKIYRFETNQGLGIYQISYKAPVEIDPNRHYAPEQDLDLLQAGAELYDCTLRKFNTEHLDKWHFGFLSKQQLKHWFNTKERRQLKASGAVLRVYSVATKATLRGRYQGCFLRHEARYVEELDVVCLDKKPSNLVGI